MNSQTNPVPHEGEPTPAVYSAPELADYGPIEVLTQGAGVGSDDGLTGSIAG